MAPVLPFPSALSALIGTYKPSSTPSNTATDHQAHALALQVLHNLQHQHAWTALTLHATSPLEPYLLLPCPLISGLPPHRVYVHPDQQVEELAAERERKAKLKNRQSSGMERSEAGAEAGREGGGSNCGNRRGPDGRTGPEEDEVEQGVDGDAGKEIEREWVLPARLGEKWSLRRFAAVFDAVGEDPPLRGGGRSEERHADADRRQDEDAEGQSEQRGRTKRRRGGKRILLATVCDDSTVSYYIMHDGIVKPRQN